MKIEQIRGIYEEASGKLSDLTRQLCFSGIAVIWILRTESKNGIPFSRILMVPLGLFVISLLSDLLQYIYKTALYDRLNIKHWREHKNESVDVRVSRVLNCPTNIFFWGKIILTLVAYAFLVFYISSRI